MDAECNRWSVRRLGDLVDVFDGPHATPPKADAGPVFLGISSLVDGRLDLAASEHIPETHFAQWTKRVVPRENDLVFSYETRIGQASLIPAGLRCCLGRRMGLLRVRRGTVDPRFLLYAYLSPEFQATLRQRTVHGSTVDRILLQELPDFPIRVPNRPEEQRAIAAVLGALDDKIDLNRRMNQTLEQIAATLFRAWFVDFEPVRAKAEGRTPVGIDAATAALFPDRLVASEIGEIPAGWRVATLGNLASVNSWTLRKSDVLERIAYIEISEVMRGEIRSITSYQRGDEPGRARRRLRHGDTALSTVRPDRGAYFLALHPTSELIASTGFAVVTPTTAPWSYVHCALTQPAVFARLGQLADGSAYPAVPPEAVLDIPAAVPPVPDVLNSFHRIAEPLFERMHANRRQNQTLAALRDLLLPRLLSGELRVPVAEAAVEEAM